MKKRNPKYKPLVQSAINAAKLSIEMFNRVEGIHSIESTLIFNSQAWELLAKAILIRNKENIHLSDGTTISAEKAVNKLCFSLKKISTGENKTIQQIISLRNEAIHNVLPDIDQEILTHLLYYSLNSFNNALKKNFRSYSTSFDKNYLSIAFKQHTFYSHKIERLLKKSKSFGTSENRLLYLLDRGCKYGESMSQNSMESFDQWKNKIKGLPRKSRVSMHLSIYSYINTQENVRFIPVQVSRGHKPEIYVKPSKNPLAPVMIKKTDPNKDFPHLTSDLARILGKNLSFTSKTIKALKLDQNDDYCTRIRTSKSGSGVPKYSDKLLNYLKDYLNKNLTFSPYKYK